MKYCQTEVHYLPGGGGQGWGKAHLIYHRDPVIRLSERELSGWEEDLRELTGPLLMHARLRTDAPPLLHGCSYGLG